MPHREFSLKAQSGVKIHAQAWLPEGNVRACILQVHGLGEHSGRYGHVADFMNRAGIAFYGFDHHGHGKTEGKRGHIPNYEALMQEIDQMLAEIRKAHPGSPIFIYGHSWGGNIALNYILRRKPQIPAAIITDPWLILPQKPPVIKAMLAKIVVNILPSFTENSGLKSSDLSTDPAVAKAYDADPLVHGKISAKNFLDSSAAAEYALAHAGQNTIPLLLMHGKEDAITSVKGTEQFYTSAGGLNQMKLWEGMKHEIHNEVQQVLVHEAMLKWIEKHLS
jgi:alpha-beta hydrolase superfamily lysophospholipase